MADTNKEIAAAMREALERCNELFRCDDDNKSRLCNLARKADEATQAALAAPARNCDTVRDGREALGRCRESVAVERDAAYDRGMRDAIRWLLAPAEKGGAK